MARDERVWAEVAGSLTHVEHRVAGLLGDPAGGRVRRVPKCVEVARGVLDHGEDVQPASVIVSTWK
ncbi:MAG: hypothetical protein JWL97_3456 [Gemmatimonadales bacterium]|jgi:hypothetical protein|nr:hypothetical protein [Gemmatimonadales bacterium]